MERTLQTVQVRSPIVKRSIGPSPIFLLPPEVLAEIFTFCLIDSISTPRALSGIIPEMERPPYLSPAHPPLIFGQVCTLWNKVALATPQLWQCFSVSVPNYHSVESLGHTVVDSWLARSKVLPVSVSINIKSPAVGYPTVTKSLLLVAHRIKHLHLSVPLSQLYPLRQIGTQMPMLETLSVTPTNLEEDLHQWDGPPVSFKGCRSLHRVAVESHGPRSLLSTTLTLPWDQLTCLRVDELNLRPNDLREFITLCTNLVEGYFTLYSRDGPEAPVQPRPISVHSRMKLLKVCFDGGFGAAAFFQTLALPALEELHIMHYDMPIFPVEGFASIRAAHERAPFPLKKLTLSRLPVDSEELLSFVGQIKTLEELVLQYCETLDAHLLLGLTSRQNQVPLVPNLTLLRIDEPRFFSLTPAIDPKLMVDMIESRWWPDEGSAAMRRTCRLAKTCIDSKFEQLDANAIERLQIMQREGLKLSGMLRPYIEG